MFGPKQHIWVAIQEIAVPVTPIRNEDGEFHVQVHIKYNLVYVHDHGVYCGACHVELTEGWGTECNSS